MNLSIRLQCLVVIAALAGLACSSSSSAGPDTVPCTGNTDCKDVTQAPTCGDTSTTACDLNLKNSMGTNGACVYHVPYKSTSCPCVSGDVRYCSTGAAGSSGAGGRGGSGGAAPSVIQDCIATGGASTSWGGCHN
jgi:hypothetical protein